MPHIWRERILILTKTYPNPSGKYRETTCVAGLGSGEKLMRLYPVPFRLLGGDQQFSKWEWIECDIHKATSDPRPESHQLHVDQLSRTGEKVLTSGDWVSRRWAIEQHLVENADALEARRRSTGETLGFVGPVELLELKMEPVKNPEWSEDEIRILTQESLFDEPTTRALPLLRKLPYRFRYRYRIGRDEFNHLVTDWEVGALFWNCRQRHGNGWEQPFRAKLEDEFAERDLYFLMGTVHQHPHVWLIVGIYYPPRQDASTGMQSGLF